MSTMIFDGTTTDALAAAVGAFGLSLMPTDAGAAIDAVSGPMLVSEGSRAGAPLPEAILGVVDRTGTSADDIMHAVATALASSIPGLDVASPQPVRDLGPTVAAYPTISEALLMMQGSEPVGVILWVTDRRGSNDRGATPSAAAPKASGPSLHGLAMLRDVELEVSVELGRTQMTLAEVLGLHIGSVVELDRPAGAPVDVRVNGTLLARGEVVVIEGEYAVRISEVIEPEHVR